MRWVSATSAGASATVAASSEAVVDEEVTPRTAAPAWRASRSPRDTRARGSRSVGSWARAGRNRSACTNPFAQWRPAESSGKQAAADAKRRRSRRFSYSIRSIEALAIALAVCCIAAWLAEPKAKAAPQARLSPASSSSPSTSSRPTATETRSQPQGRGLRAVRGRRCAAVRAFEFINLSSIATTRPLPPGLASNDRPGGLFTVVIDEIGVQVDDVPDVRRITEKILQGHPAA